MSQRFALLFTAIVVHFIATAQNQKAELFKRCSVKTINYEQGLLNNGITNIITDKLGFTWISTKTGMQRYNGYALETINPVINKEIISIHSPVYFLALKNGKIWVGYKEGILEYDAPANSFKKILSIPNSGNFNFLLVPVKETGEGIWCIKRHQGIVLCTRQGTIIKELTTAGNVFTDYVFKQKEIINNTTFATNENSIFIYNGQNEIQRIDVRTNKISYIKTDNIYSLCCSADNLFTISNKALLCINIENQKVKKSILLKEIIRENVNFGYTFLSDNHQLLISVNNYLFEYDTSFNHKKEFTNLNQNPLVPQGFIKSVYTDRYKRIWLLTNDDIKRIQNVDIPFEHFIYAAEKNNFIRSIYYDEQKHVLLAGCYNGGIQLYDTLGNALWQNAIISENIKDINAIEKLTDNIYFIETIGHGWYTLNLLSKKVKPFALHDSLKKMIDFYKVNYVNNIQRVDDSTVFIATALNVFRCVFKNENLTSVTPLLPSKCTVADLVDCFIYTSNHVLWTGTDAGLLYKMDGNNHLETFYIPANYLVRSLTEDALHNIWAGTDKGLYVYNQAGELIKNITVQSGLLNDCMYALLPVANKSAVFASSNLGLSYVSLNGNISNYSKESGLQENEFNTGSVTKTLSGKCYFGGVNGITSFYPASLSIIKDTPILNVIKLVINDSVYNPSSLFPGHSMQLNYAQNHIQLGFAATGLFNVNEYKYRYRLHGFEEKWQITHQPSDIRYILGPGEYFFEINCSPALSLNSVFTKTIRIIISPPWWQTWLFKVIITAIFVGIIAFIVQQYLHRQYQKKLRVLQLQQEIQHERERISRDLHDNLGAYAAAISMNVASIKNPLNEMYESVLQKLQANSRSIIDQLNDTIWALNKEAISLTAVSDRFKVFLQKIQPNYPNINITIEENIVNDQKLSPANALHLFRIMQEAVNNALRHSKCENIFITINSGNVWSVIIKDDGKGLAGLNEKIIAGNGLRNIQMRSEEAGWKVKWKTPEPKGTELIISS